MLRLLDWQNFLAAKACLLHSRVSQDWPISEVEVWIGLLQLQAVGVQLCEVLHCRISFHHSAKGDRWNGLNVEHLPLMFRTSHHLPCWSSRSRGGRSLLRGYQNWEPCSASQVCHMLFLKKFSMSTTISATKPNMEKSSFITASTRWKASAPSSQPVEHPLA